MMSGLEDCKLAIDKQCPLPEMALYLKDKVDHYTEGTFMIAIDIPEFEVFYLGGPNRIKEPTFAITSAPLGMVFKAGYWTAIPRCSGVMLSSEQVKTELRKAQVRVTILQREKQVSQTKEVSVTIEPGKPARVVWVNQGDEAALRCENKTVIQGLQIKLVDSNGNLTAPPRGTTWKVNAQASDTFIVVPAPDSTSFGGNQAPWTVSSWQLNSTFAQLRSSSLITLTM